MKLVRNPSFVATEMDGDLVMMSIENGEYYGLTGIAPRIWDVLGSPHTVKELLDELLQQYDVAEMVLAADVDLFLSDMKQNGLVQPA